MAGGNVPVTMARFLRGLLWLAWLLAFSSAKDNTLARTPPMGWSRLVAYRVRPPRLAPAAPPYFAREPWPELLPRGSRGDQLCLCFLRILK